MLHISIYTKWSLPNVLTDQAWFDQLCEADGLSVSFPFIQSRDVQYDLHNRAEGGVHDRADGIGTLGRYTEKAKNTAQTVNLQVVILWQFLNRILGI